MGETVSKILGAMFLDKDGEVEKSKIQKFKDGLLWMILGAGLFLAAIMYLA